MPRFALNRAGHDYAVGDIHGCYSALQAGLDRMGFDPENDRLFSVGDLVNRGPESMRVLEWLDLPWFHAICGNHDLMIWRAALGAEVEAVDYRAHGGAWFERLPSAERLRIGERLSRLPLVAEVETLEGIVGLVHADCPRDDWDEMRRTPWADLDPDGPIGACCLWSRDRHVRQDRSGVRNVRAVVHGHVAVVSAEVLGNVHYIDSCGWRPGGHFTFLDLQSLLPLRGPVLPRRR